MPAGSSRGGSGGSALPESELERHIAWDIGIRACRSSIAAALDATLVMQLYSRLVIDCNRDLLVPSSIVRDVSETDRSPRQHGPRSAADRLARQEEIFWPYHERIGGRARTPRAERQADGARLDAQLHAGLQRRRAAVACRRALQSRPASSAGILLDLLRKRGRPRRRRQRAVFRQRPDRLHDPRARRAARPAACRDRDPAGPDCRGAGPARMGGPLRPAPAGGANASAARKAERMAKAGNIYPYDARRSGRDPATTLLFIDVQNFCAVRNGGEFKDSFAAGIRGKARLFLRRAGEARRSQHAAPAGRLPQGRNRGDVHADPQPHEGRARPQPRLQDHRLQRAARLVGRGGDRRHQAARRRDRHPEDLVERLLLDQHRLHPAQSRHEVSGHQRRRDRPVRRGGGAHGLRPRLSRHAHHRCLRHRQPRAPRELAPRHQGLLPPAHDRRVSPVAASPLRRRHIYVLLCRSSRPPTPIRCSPSATAWSRRSPP